MGAGVLPRSKRERAERSRVRIEQWICELEAMRAQVECPVGQLLRRGAFVGRVGGPGLSTGPPLHWDVRIRSLNVDPMQLTRQSLP